MEKTLHSKIFYFFLGLFIAVSVPGVYAWNSAVSSGDPLTVDKWNDLVAKVEDLDSEVSSSGDFYCRICIRGQNECSGGFDEACTDWVGPGDSDVSDWVAVHDATRSSHYDCFSVSMECQ